MKKEKVLHIAIIIIGAIFIALSAFHEGLWFDESYSVAISNNHTFSEIWSIGGNDVHPIFYYFMLKVVSLIFGNKIILYRLLSVLATIILGILGYTHIRKDFGEKVGLFFSFFVFFLPVTLTYAGEIRMYSCGMLFVSIAAIYAYRLYKTEQSAKNWIIFAIFSLISAYTHYYGLIAAGIINLMLFIKFVVDAVKEKKWTKALTCFTIQAVVQIILYLPWLISMIIQMSHMSGGFWVGFTFPDTLIEMFTFQFSGNLGLNGPVNNYIVTVYGTLVISYIAYLIWKNKNADMLPAKKAIAVYAGVILGAALVSLVIWKFIVYARYFMLVTGLFIFFISYILASYGSKKVNIAIGILTVLMAIVVNISFITDNYDASNKMPMDYIKENIQEGDVLVYTDRNFSGFIVSAKFPTYKQYFYDIENWHVEKAYEAFGPNMEYCYNLDSLKDYKGRIWFIGADNYELYEQASKEFDDIKLIEQKSFSTKYKGYQFTFSITQKGE